MKGKFRKLFLLAVIEFAVLAGAPVRPEQVEEFLHQMNRPKLAHVLKEQANHDDPEEPA